MTKEQQIEEMTKLIQAKEIHPCDDDEHCEDCYCVCKGMAEMIYNAGYRKVPKYAVILSPEERDEEMKAYNEERVEFDRLKAENERFVSNMKNVLEIEKKNAVKEFARKVKKCSYCDNDFMDGKWHRYVFVDDIDKLLKERENDN